MNTTTSCTSEGTVFFSLDEPYTRIMSNRPGFHKIKSSGTDYGIILEDLDILDKDSDSHLLRMRARREYPGLSLSAMEKLP